MAWWREFMKWLRESFLAESSECPLCNEPAPCHVEQSMREEHNEEISRD